MHCKKIVSIALICMLVFLMAGCDYARAVPATVLHWGSRGGTVSDVQRRLKQWGYYDGAVDGVYGTGTSQAVKEFQRKNGLTADGVVGGQHGGGSGYPALRQQRRGVCRRRQHRQ